MSNIVNYELFLGLELLKNSLFYLAENDKDELFKNMVSYYPELLKVKAKINDYEITIFTYCMMIKKYELAKFLLEQDADQYENMDNLAVLFCFKLDEDIIEALMNRSMYKTILANGSLGVLVLCFQKCHENANILLKYLTSEQIDKYMSYLNITKQYDTLRLLFKKLQDYKLLQEPENYILHSISNVELAQLYEEYMNFEECKDKRLYYAFLYGDMGALEYIYNSGNFSDVCLDTYIKNINNEKVYIDKFRFMMLKGSTVNNIDSVKSVQLRRILTNNKEYVFTSTIQVECTICSDDINIGDVIVKLPCTHQFHEECFNSWKINCPACRWE